MTQQITITVLITMLILISEHYWPWRLILGHKLGRLQSYVFGMLAIVLPYSGLLFTWERWHELLALGLVVGIGGLAVFGMYALDRYLIDRDRADAAEQAEKVLKDGTLAE